MNVLVSKLVRASMLGVVSLSCVRMKEKDVYDERGKLVDGCSMRRHFITDTHLIKSFTESIFEIRLPFVDRKIFFEFPRNEVISVPKNMMDGSSYLSDIRKMTPGKPDLKYKIVNPISFLLNDPNFGKKVYKKNTVLEELISYNFEMRPYDEEGYHTRDWRKVNKEIFDARREKLGDIINNIELSEFDEFDPYEFHEELRDVYRAECKILNRFDHDKYGIVYIPDYQNIEAWFEKELDQYRKNKHLKHLESIKEKEASKSLSILIWNLIYGKKEESKENLSEEEPELLYSYPAYD